jgi:hypothetical protein
MIHIETLDTLTDFLGIDLSRYEACPVIQHPGLRISYAFAEVSRRIRSGDRR